MGGASTEQVDFYDLKGVVEALLDSLHLTPREIAFEPVEHNSFHPGRVATLIVKGEPVGILGEVHPVVREAFGLGLDLKKPVLAAEINLAMLMALIPIDHAVIPIPEQPPAYRDLAVVVDERRPAAEIEAIIWSAGGNLLREVQLFDVYRGESIDTGKKSLAYALTFQSGTETLNDKKVNKLQKKIISKLEKSGASLRA